MQVSWSFWGSIPKQELGNKKRKLYFFPKLFLAVVVILFSLLTQ